ncbi:hypothetical protein P3T36_002728 [Kitasatospora sp. MAP12-15]|uniref:hypothetical protein n=1 Tax=unclassified Kitasatospora TaxID=2633591 RepID=UPI002476B39A|nr:hypothetical protein [Kitasatospora sp. MAP12-44]MDH6113907.1 hypothetical protein [Kitasatospora sp. MAP12-44]
MTHPDHDGSGVAAGSIRDSLTVLGLVAGGAELAFALAGGLAGAAMGAAVLAAVALPTARYVIGAAAEDSGYRKNLRMMGSHSPSINDWHWTVRNGLDENGFTHVLRPRLQRLYASRLSEQHGVSLLNEPAAAAALVGPELWPWLDPEQPAPDTTVPEPVLVALVARLEAL